MNSNYLSCANKSAHPPPPVTDKMVSLPYWWLKKKKKKTATSFACVKKRTLKKEGGKTCCEARAVFPVVSSTARGEEDHRTWRWGWKNQTLSRGEPLSVSSIPATHDQAHGGDSGPVGVRRFLFRMSSEAGQWGAAEATRRASSGGARPLV